MSIQILKRRSIELPQKSSFAVEGEYTLRRRKAENLEVVQELTFKNVITNWGLNHMGNNGNGVRKCYVGTGTNTPSTSDTSMGTFLAQTDITVNTRIGGTPSAPDYIDTVSGTGRFGVGVAAGNLTEVGVGFTIGGTPATDHRVFSRALIVDGFGNPTSITVLSDEILDVTYTCKLHPVVDDVEGSVVIAGTTHDTVQRPAQWPSVLALRLTTARARAFESCSSYSGELGAITSTPLSASGTSTNGTGYTEDAYSENSFKRTGSISAGLDYLNAAGGIKSLMFNYYSIGNLFIANRQQIQFTPVIPKDSTKVLVIYSEISWGRYTP